MTIGAAQRSNDLPSFRYHPDPLATESIIESQKPCVCCGQARGFDYVGPVSGPDGPDGSICPWCIANGQAAEVLDVEFDAGDGSSGIAPAIVDELVSRTPGFLSWQQSYWEYHCEDACAYLGRVGARELKALPAPATEAARHALQGWGGAEQERETTLATFHKDSDLSCYLFQCLHCGAYLAHFDMS